MERQRSERRRIAIIGAGNVGENIAIALDNVADVVCIYSRVYEKAQTVASLLKTAQAVNDLSAVDRTVDTILIAVADDAIGDVAGTFDDFDGIVAHTSGSVPITALKSKHRGVFYPLQTFTRGKRVDISQVPFFIEGSDVESVQSLRELALTLSPRVYDADSAHRAALHIAAVFACNFANYLWDEADKLLKPYGYGFDVFAPLLKEALQKAETVGPHNAQTGPAMRHDMNIIAYHKQQLSPELCQIYDLLTQRIMNTHNTHHFD